ncbi:hypothetical protein [Pseudonocardia adelaidensis]|uniref:Bh protein n=1 Tax=Pseudonocardia adelaidensis TaxID=648754 RepID=A0ABP9NQ64_9PSEU
MQRYVVPLQCRRCGSERAHAVVYLGTIIARVTCSECGEVVAPRPDVLLERYLRDFELRLADKPGKMLRHARTRPVDFLFHYLPLGLIRKPGEILREWTVLVGASSPGPARTPGCAERRPAGVPGTAPRRS